MRKPASLTQFKKKTAHGDSHLIFGRVPALAVEVQFSGKLQREEVLWNARIQTLASYHQEFLTGASMQEREKHLYSFFEVAEPQKQVARLHVVLAVPMTDEPTIKKTMVMIRCYKRLQPGKHFFGKNL